MQEKPRTWKTYQKLLKDEVAQDIAVLIVAIGTLCLIAFLFNFIGDRLEAKAEVTYDIPREYQLETLNENILGEEFYVNEKTRQNEVQYSYKGEELKIENATEIGSNYIKYENSMKIYPGDVFYKPVSEEKVYSIEYATTTADYYLEQRQPYEAEIIGKFFNHVLAETEYSTLDGRINSYSASGWTAARNATCGTSNDFTSTTFLVRNNPGAYIDRARLNFDTSVITSDYLVTSSTIYLYSNDENTGDNDGKDYIAIIDTSATSTSAQNCDFSRTTPTKISNQHDITGKLNTWYNFIVASSTINRTGLSYYMLSEGHDIDNEASIDWSGTSFRASEYTGTDYDPYLYIEYELIEEEEATSTPTSTTTPYNGITGMEYSDDLSIITAYREHYESSSITPDWIEYDYYHIPFFVYIVIAVPTIWIGSRLILELIIRLRK